MTRPSAEPDPASLSRAELAAYLRSVAVVDVAFTGRCLGISRPAAFRAAQAGLIRAIRVSPHRLVVPSTWLEKTLMLGDEADGNQSVGAPAGPLSDVPEAVVAR